MWRVPIPAALATIMIVLTVLPFAVGAGSGKAENLVEPPAAAGLIGERMVYEAKTIDRVELLRIERLPAWVFTDAHGQQVEAAPMVIHRSATSSEIWLHDPAAYGQIAVMSVERATDTMNAATWNHEIDFASAGHCLDQIEHRSASASCRLSAEERASQTVEADWTEPIPVPTRLAAGAVEWTLVSHEWGSDAYTIPERKEPTPARISGPEVPWGVGDENVSHAFPLSDAFKKATENSPTSEYSNWRSQQTNAFPVAGDLDISRRLGGARATWTLVVQGDDSYATLSSTAQITFTKGPVHDLWLMHDVPPGDATAVEPGRWRASDGTQPAPVDWPSVENATERVWRTAIPDPQPPLTAWRFTESCAHECDHSGPALELRFSADEYLAFHNEMPEGPYRSASVWMSPSGQIVHVEYSSTQRFHPTLAASATASTIPVESDPTKGVAIVVVSALGTALALRVLWKHLAAFAGFAFQKTNRSESPKRREILDLILAEPGIHFAQILRRMRISNGTAVHHLDTLLRRGAVRAVTRGGYRCYFAATTQEANLDAILALKAGGARRIIQALQEGPKSRAALARDTGLSSSTVAYHVGKMTSAGLLAREDTHGRRTFALTILGRRLVT